MSLAHMFYAKQAFRRAMRWAKQWRQQRRTVHPSRPFMLEALEPRLLMSASPIAPEQIALGETKDAAISVPGEQDRFTFTLAQPGQVIIDTLSAANNQTVWLLDGPQGRVTNSFGFGDSGILNLTAGDFLLTVNGTGDAAGAYSFRILDITNGPATQLTLGTPVTGATLSPLSKLDLYQFTAPANTRIFPDLLQISSGSIGASIINPSGTAFGLYFDSAPITLTEGGTYKLLINGFIGNGNSGSPITYGFNLQPVQDDTATLIVGAETVGSIVPPGQQDKYNFAITQESFFILDSLTNDSNLTWRLDGSKGVVVGFGGGGEGEAQDSRMMSGNRFSTS